MTHSPSLLQKKYSRDLYLPELQMLVDYGEPVDVHGRKTLEILNFNSIVEESWHHCILVPSRRWNPWLALSEALWIMAGRNDIAALEPYNSRIKDYSDDGVHLYGAYGARIHDQIDDVIDRLRMDPSDRRAVLSIWEPSDLMVLSKDPPCLSGDTVVYSPEGNKPISELVGQRVPVYTLNEKTKKIEFKWAVGVKRGLKKTITIVFDDGSRIRSTPEHLFLTKTRKRIGDENKHGSTITHQWIAAKELTPDTSIVPIHLITGSKGHISYYEDITQNWAGTNRKAVHREYWSWLNGQRPLDYDVHHNNHVPSDNRSDNLILIKHGAHSQHHRSTALRKEPRNKTELRKTRPDKKDWTTEELLDLGAVVLAKYDSLAWWRFNKEYKGIVSGTVVQGRFGSWSNFVSAVVGNHKVTSIEEGFEEEVYDLQVEENHNFFISPGVLVHNCNNLVYFKLRGGKLHMTVICRSNDIHWGLFAVNLPTFGILQSYIAARLGVWPGTQTHFSNSLHVYTDNEEVTRMTDRMLYKETEDLPTYPVHERAFIDLSHIQSHTEFAEMCSVILDEEQYTAGFPRFLRFAGEFLECYKNRELKPQITEAWRHYYPDWIMAGQMWADKVWK